MPPQRGRILEMAALAGMRYGKSSGNVGAENCEAEINTRFRPASWVPPFIYTKAIRDRIRNIDARISAAAGAELNLVRPTDNRVSVGLAVLEEDERRLIPAGNPDPRSVASTRFNLLVAAKPVLRKGLPAEHRTQFEPAAGDSGDYLLTSQTPRRVLLTGGLALQTSYQYNFDSTPAPGVTSRSGRLITTGLIVEIK